MKVRILFIAFAVTALTLQSCEELLQGIPITFDLTETVTMDVMPKGTFTIEEEVETKAEDQVATVGATLDDVKSIKINSIELAINDANTDASFDAFDRVEVSIEADGLDEVIIASKELTETGITSVEIDMNDVELADYLKKEIVKYKLSWTTNADIETAFDVDVKSNVTIQVQIPE